MAGLDVKVSQLGEVVVTSDNDLLNLVTYDEQNQTYVSGKVKASTMKDYMIGDTDISDLGDGTPTGAIDALDGKIDDNYDEWKEQWQKNGAYNICPNNATPQVVNQITYAVNSSNKTITATWSTTPSGNSPLLIAARGALKLKAGTTYKLVGCPAGGGWSAGNFKYRVFIQDNTAGTDIQDTGSGIVFTPTEDHEYTVYIAIAQHAGASGNLIFKPMVTTDLNATYDDYVEYAMTNRQLTENVFVKRTLTSGDNLNDIKVTGIYGVTSAPTNSPENQSYGSLIVQATSSGDLRQLFMRAGGSGGLMYVRSYGGSPASWTNWFKFTGTVVS